MLIHSPLQEATQCFQALLGPSTRCIARKRIWLLERALLSANINEHEVPGILDARATLSMNTENKT